MHADETIIFYTGPDTNKIMKILQKDLNRVTQWMSGNRLVLNQAKTKVMLFGTKIRLGKISGFTEQLHGHDIEIVSKFSYLGVMLDERITSKEHTEVVCNKVGYREYVLVQHLT